MCDTATSPQFLPGIYVRSCVQHASDNLEWHRASVPQNRGLCCALLQSSCHVRQVEGFQSQVVPLDGRRRAIAR